MISNRRIPKTVCPVVWEAARAQSRAADPISLCVPNGTLPMPHTVIRPWGDVALTI